MSLHTASQSSASTVTQSPAITYLTKPIWKPLTIPETQVWNCHLAYILPTAPYSLIDGYSKDHPISTVCIQAKYKLKMTNVKTKDTTKLFELIPLDVCGPFARYTSSSHCNYILVIDDYTQYNSIWVLLGKTWTTSIAANKSFQTRVDSMECKLKVYWYNCGHGE